MTRSNTGDISEFCVHIFNRSYLYTNFMLIFKIHSDSIYGIISGFSILLKTVSYKLIYLIMTTLAVER